MTVSKYFVHRKTVEEEKRIDEKYKQRMKFRCTANSIRFRVRKSDLEALESRGEVRERITFGPGVVLSFVLKLGEGEAIHAGFFQGAVIVEVPRRVAREWISSAEVGLEVFQGTGVEGAVLHVLIEKDFPCRHTTEANREDTFYELAPEDPSVC